MYFLFSIFYITIMAKNLLALHVPDIMSSDIMHIEDHSVYDPLMSYICPTLKVRVPGFSEPVVFNDTTALVVNKGFAFNLTACDLQLQLTNCGTEFNTLTDGIYAISYSISPNDKVCVEINHLRVTCLMHNWKNEMCKLRLGACEPSGELRDKFNALKEIKSYIDAAKAKADVCFEAEEAMTLYEYAKKLLDKIQCKTC